MKSLWFLTSTRFLKLIKFFAHTDETSERRFFGLGQFVLLLTLAPFIFNLSLYSFGKAEKVPSHYVYNPDRFESLPPFPNFPVPPTAPKGLSKWESKRLNYCKNPPKIVIIPWVFPKECRSLSSKQSRYAASYKNYIAKLKKYGEAIKKFEKVKAAHQNFSPSLSTKPSAPIAVNAYATRAYSAMLGESLEVDAWRQVAKPTWLLGLLLTFPTVWLCIKRQRWGLLWLGLSVPAFNYALFVLTVFLGWEALSNWQISSGWIPKIAFLYFVFKGQIRSKSFALFILLLVLCTLIPAFSNQYPNFSALKAQLPILVFIVVTAIARLIVKGIYENGYLIKNLGWGKSIRTGLRALVLWLPMALLAFPFFYLTEIMLPKHVVNQLHTKKVLQFNHEHDILDNALQSTAVKSDDAMYAWHLNMESMKRDIYAKGAKLENINLKQSVEEKYDVVMPNSLTFEDYDSDAFLVAPVVELSVDASQESTNKAYKKLRGSIRKSLGNIAADNDIKFKQAVKKSKGEALKVINDMYVQGRDAILEANHTAQTSLWWTMNYVRAAHQLTLLFFAFICLKSLGYVFARVSFNRDTGSFITLGDTQGHLKDQGNDSEDSHIKRTGLQYLINSDKEETFYISRRFQCRGKAPKFTIPQAFHAPIARLFNGAWSMNKVIMRKGDDDVSCTAAQGIEFFEWDLRDGEAVIFDFHNFVGITESVKISTLISTRISSLLLGKMIYSQATGPGKLILMAKGRAEITDSKSNGGSLPPERLVAMQTNTRLHIDSELDIVNVYLSTAYVRPAGGGQVIVDVDSQRGTKTGLASFLKRFILPV